MRESILPTRALRLTKLRVSTQALCRLDDSWCFGQSTQLSKLSLSLLAIPMDASTRSRPFSAEMRTAASAAHCLTITT